MNKKRVLIILAVIVIVASIFLIYKSLNSNNKTLVKIANAFNAHPEVLKNKINDNDAVATVNKNTLTINKTYNDKTYEFVYTLSDNIVSMEFTDNESIPMEKLLSLYLLDSYGKVSGYEYNELLCTLENKDINKYTLGNEGLETKDNGIMFDITKKIPLIEDSTDYFSKEVLETIKENINYKSKASYQMTYGDMKFNILFNENNITLYVGESKGITDKVYDSVVSILTVMFDSEVVSNYFKENYTSVNSLYEGDINAVGLSISLNPGGLEEYKVMDEYNFIKVILDKGVLSSKFNIIFNEE